MTETVPESPQLLLANVRQALVRMEETILFSLIERAQFRRNPPVYAPGAFPSLDPHQSLVGHLLRETERAHAALRRYTSPDEHPFFAGLPEPRLPPLAYRENPLRANAVNLNAELLGAYEGAVVARLCPAGDDSQYGSSAVCDVACLQALSRRVHYGKFVAEGKRQEEPARFAALLAQPDDAALLAAVTRPEVEQAVLERVRRKATTYLAELRQQGGSPVPEPDVIATLYRDLIFPLNKRVQVAYLRATAP